MRVELLYCEGCPGYVAFLPRLEGLLQEAGAGVLVLRREIVSVEDAEQNRFLGSPTLRIDGRDVEPGADEREDFGIKHRLYLSDEGVSPAPPESWVWAAIREAQARAARLAESGDRQLV